VAVPGIVPDIESRLPNLFTMDTITQRLEFANRTATVEEANLILTMKTFTGQEKFQVCSVLLFMILSHF
jgi:hypothetical protein